MALEREAGTPEAEQARALVTDYLESLGYAVAVQRFRFHPSGLLAFPLFGAGLGLLGLLVFPLLTGAVGPGWAAVLVWVTGLAAVAALALGVGAGWLPIGESREDANLVARRNDEVRIERWLVAHLDSKAQGHSMAGRLLAVWAVVAAVALLSLAVLLRLGGPLPLLPAGIVTGAAVLAGALAGRGTLRGRSRGARDNGSGVAAVLAAAAATSDPATGVLITGAEEFGLVGARIFAQLEGGRLAGAEVINFDTIDQEGGLYLVSHERRGAGLAAHYAGMVARLGPPVRQRRLPLGILVDSLPLARAGAAAITIGRLTWRTLRLIHTPRDVPDGLTLELAERVGRAVVTN